MRKLLLLVSLCFTLGIAAQHVTEQQALLKARAFMKDKAFSPANKARSIKGKAQGIPYRQFYIFNVEDDGGFVIVSGDERAKEILAYSDSGHLNYGELPDNLKGWLDFYEEAIKAIPARTTASRAVSRAPKAEVKPLMTFAWNQYDPYNKYCPASPEDPTQTSVTGCVATAMAQMMYYHKWPNTLPALDSYVYYNKYSVPALDSKPMDWNNNDDLYWLSRYCGQSVNMAYGKNGSSAHETMIPSVMVNKFGYDGAERVVFRNAYNADTWDNMMYDELANKRPFIYSGHDLSQEGIDYGHTFICDGYKDGLYHVNWGWGSYFNKGYYALDVMDSPDGCSYSSKQIAVIGIQPPNGGTADYPSFSCTKMEVSSDLEVSRASSTSEFENITISWEAPATILNACKLEMAVALLDGTQPLSVLAYYGINQIEPDRYYYHNVTVFIDSWIPDGTYTIAFVYKDPNKDTNESDWHLATGSDYRYISATISGNKLTLKNHPSSDPDEPDTPNATDIVEVINFLLGNPSGTFDKKAADTTGDQKINIADIIQIINNILSAQ